MAEKDESSLKEFEEGRIHRRKALSTMGRVAAGVAAAAVVGGAAYYAGTQTTPRPAAEVARTVTQTVTTTQAAQTLTQTVARTETLTAPERTVTQTVTATAPGVAAKLATDRETLLIGISLSGVITLDPHEAFENVAGGPLANAYHQLLSYSPPNFDAVDPGVAESWTRSDDGLTWTFKIRDGMKFSNGDRLDAKAVEYSLKRLLALKKPVAFWANIVHLKDLNKIKGLDSKTVQFTVEDKAAKSTVEAAFAVWAYSIVNPNITEANAKDKDWGNAWLKEHSAGTGPYVIESWERDNQIVLKANENYWKDAPRIKKIIFKHIPEPTVQSLLIQKGDLDFGFGTGDTGLPVDAIEKLKGVDGVAIGNMLSRHINYIGMNVGNPKDTPLKDNRVRLAVRWSIDYDGLVNGILKGGGAVLQTLIPPGLVKYHLPSKPFFKNPAKAKQLLAEAGYPNGFDIDFAVPAGEQPHTIIAALHQSTWAEAGIRAKIISEARGEMFAKMRRQSQQLILASWGGGFLDPENYGTGHTCYGLQQIAWRNMYQNDKQCRLAQAAAKEDNEVERIRLYKELQEEMLKDTSSAVTHVEKYFFARRTWTEAFDMSLILPYHTDFSRVYKEKVVT